MDATRGGAWVAWAVVDSVTDTPTEPHQYAAISATYGTLLAALAYASRRRAVDAEHELVPLVAATFALSKLIAKEKVETWVRTPFVQEGVEGRPPKGTGVRYAVGELLTCTRCLGAWSALGLVGLRMAAPEVGRTVTTVLAASAGSDVLQAGFTYMTERANVEGKRGAQLSD